LQQKEKHLDDISWVENDSSLFVDELNAVLGPIGAQSICDAAQILIATKMRYEHTRTAKPKSAPQIATSSTSNLTRSLKDPVSGKYPRRHTSLYFRDDFSPRISQINQSDMAIS
jgi:hypothetical protein